jgi:hypothetical protein
MRSPDWEPVRHIAQSDCRLVVESIFSSCRLVQRDAAARAVRADHHRGDRAHDRRKAGADRTCNRCDAREKMTEGALAQPALYRRPSGAV